ncbi:MAG TPA: nucleotidyltransferase family protein [Bacillales bacterium]|nr:nucleotidyltransferase family protein [Bacillales bacterium]
MGAAGVTALVLAAGTSSRMGTTKQLLDFGGTPLLQKVIEKVLLFDFSGIIAVVGHEAEQIKRSVRISDERFRWIVNPEYSSGQSTSLRSGIESCNSPGVMVFLGDEPLISNQTIQTVYQFAMEKQSILSEPFVVRPSFQSVPGHPVFFGNAQKIDFSRLEGDRGAKKVVGSLEAKHIIHVNDRGILSDVDTPEDYEKVKQIWLQETIKKG